VFFIPNILHKASIRMLWDPLYTRKRPKDEPKLSNPIGAATERNPKGFTLRVKKAKLKL
jgi:hypothetical protein